MPVTQPTTRAYLSRLQRLSLLDGEGAVIGRVEDVVIVPSNPGEPPPVIGFVVGTAGRRRIFVNGNKVADIDASGVRLVQGTVDYRAFRKREGELLARADIVGRHVGSEVVADLSIIPTPLGARAWQVHDVALGAPGVLRRRRTGRTVTWKELPELFDTGRQVDRQVAALRDLHPSEVAARVVRLPLAQRRQLAEAMEDPELADLLEELPEDEQIRLIQDLGVERVAIVLGEMEADDAADLLAEMSEGDREEVLGAMEDEEQADDLRRLLSYDSRSAGGLMTPEPLILRPDVTVGEALARLREFDLPQVLACNVFVTEPPTEAPTGRYLGMVGFQRLLRVPPGEPIGQVLDDEAPEPVSPDAVEGEVARRLAAYDGLALPVVDRAGRLLGAVTVDDVLDRILPVGWRRR
ncbi:MAG: CBS domain-containing protein [Acidimicrobiales bacterium]